MSTDKYRARRLSNKTTPLSTYIQKRLEHKDMTWSELCKQAKMPKANSTRLRRKGWIPNTAECNRLAAALDAPWQDVWIMAGHVTKEQLETMQGSQLSYSYLWRLTPEEASIIGAYRACLQDSRNFLLAAVRGVARASEHEFHDDVKTTMIRTELALDFVNRPDYIAPLYGDKQTSANRGLLSDHPDISMMDLPYAAQSAIVGILRFVSTGKMSPIPSWLFSNREYLPDMTQIEVEKILDYTSMDEETNSSAMTEKWERRYAEGGK